jgi:hypothetical protein
MGKKKQKPRNPLHDDPRLRKGGVHQKPPKALRRREKVRLRNSDFGRNEDLVPSVSVAKLVMHHKLKFN